MLLLELRLARQFGVVVLFKCGPHRHETLLQRGRAQLERIEVDGEFDVLQDLRIDALLALELEAHEIDRQVGGQATDQRLWISVSG